MTNVANAHAPIHMITRCMVSVSIQHMIARCYAETDWTYGRFLPVWQTPVHRVTWHEARKL